MGTMKVVGGIAKLAEANRLKTMVENTLPFPDATRDQEPNGRGYAGGKILLRVV
jgi:hypothetical protein